MSTTDITKTAEFMTAVEIIQGRAGIFRLADFISRLGWEAPMRTLLFGELWRDNPASRCQYLLGWLLSVKKRRLVVFIGSGEEIPKYWGALARVAERYYRVAYFDPEVRRQADRGGQLAVEIIELLPDSRYRQPQINSEGVFYGAAVSWRGNDGMTLYIPLSQWERIKSLFQNNV